MDQANADALLSTPTYRRARAAALAGLAAGHRAVLLLSDHAVTAAALLRTTAGELAPAGRAVHRVDARRLAAADLSHADHRVVVAVSDVGDCEAVELRILDQALTRPSGPQLLLSATPAFRARTGSSGCLTLHLAPLVVHLPPLPDGDAATYLQALTGRAAGRRTRRALRVADGDPLLIERLSRRTVPGAAELASWPALAAVLDRPRAALAAALALAAAASLALVLVSAHPSPPSPERFAAPAPAPAPAPTPETAPLPPAPADNAPLVDGDLADENGAGSQSDTAVTVSRVDPDDVLSPRLVKIRPGETLAALYRRAYRGLVAPPFAAIRSLNPGAIRPGVLVICPAPAAGWPASSR